MTALVLGGGGVAGIAWETGILLGIADEQPAAAVAASCAVPGAWSPVTIGGRRFMDGGIGSTINLHLVEECSAAVVLVPAGVTAPSAFGAGVASELGEFRGDVLGVFADQASLAAFGPNPLDPRCRPACAEAGRAQGRREAAAVADFLGVS